MPTYNFRCPPCDHTFELQAPMSARVTVCERCQGPADRQFTPTAAIAIPAHFRMTRGWHLPAKDSPAWAGMQKEGQGRKQRDEDTLEREFQKAGLIR